MASELRLLDINTHVLLTWDCHIAKDQFLPLKNGYVRGTEEALNKHLVHPGKGMVSATPLDDSG